MDNSKKNYYVVLVGRKPGIYETWIECREQTDCFPRSLFQCFEFEKDALNYQNQHTQTINNVIYLALDKSWDNIPESNNDKVYISREWIFSNLDLSEKQYLKLTGIE